MFAFVVFNPNQCKISSPHLGRFVPLHIAPRGETTLNDLYSVSSCVGLFKRDRGHKESINVKYARISVESLIPGHMLQSKPVRRIED